MSKGSPKPPDPFQTAAAQAGANKEAIETSAAVSAVDSSAPWGSTTFTRNEKGVPTKQTITLGDKEQQFYDSSGDIRNALANIAQGYTGNLPTTPFAAPPEGSGDAVSKALYERRYNMIKPQLEEADKSLELNLSERGIPIGSEIYNQEMDRLGRARSDTLTALSQDATLAGGAEEDRQLSRALTLRAQPFNEISAFLQGAPAVPTPQFQGTPAYQMAAPDIAGLIQNNYANQVSAQNQRNSALSSGLFGLGSAAIGLSDRRAKMDIKRIGTLDNGIGVFGFRYREGAGNYQIGVMAQEVEEVVPEAVVKVPGKHGLLMVNYELLAHAVEGTKQQIGIEQWQ